MRFMFLYAQSSVDLPKDDSKASRRQVEVNTERLSVEVRCELGRQKPTTIRWEGVVGL